MSIPEKINNISKETNKLVQDVEGVANTAGTFIKDPSRIVEYLRNVPIFKSKLNVVLLLLVIALLCFTSYMVYTTVLLKRLNPKYVSNNELGEGDEENNNVLKLYHAIGWCNYSQQVLEPTNGTWVVLKKEIDNTIINGKKIKLEEVDCSNLNNPEKNDSLDDLDEETKDIDGYPTIKLLTGGKEIIYNNDISDSTLAVKQLKEFIHSNI